jgi:NAD(P)-dependent dehydrogenase (short-subunit alcohol dehydrogenase family)
MSTKQKTAIVTSASQGIGAAITNLFLNRGYNVVGTSRHISSKKEPRMSATVLCTCFRRVAAGLAASLALGALSAHAAPTPFPADFRSSRW